MHISSSTAAWIFLLVLTFSGPLLGSTKLESCANPLSFVAEDEKQEAVFLELYAKEFTGENSLDARREAESQVDNPYNLTLAERIAIKGYTSTDYAVLNSAIRKGGTELVKYQPYIDTLNRALAKLPDYVGLVERHDNLPRVPIDMREDYADGKNVIWNTFTGGSVMGTPVAQPGADVMIIQSHHGKLLGNYAHSEVVHEREVLFPPGTKIHVKQREVISKYLYRYSIEEIGP